MGYIHRFCQNSAVSVTLAMPLFTCAIAFGRITVVVQHTHRHVRDVKTVIDEQQ